MLAVRVDERSQSVREKFGAIPYLNSSLFEDSDIQQFPVPEAPEAQQALIIERVQQILKLTTTGFDSAQPTNGSLSGVEGNILALEAEIDQLVYALYGLTDEEIALVESASAKRVKQ